MSYFIIGVDPASKRNMGIGVLKIEDYENFKVILHKTEVFPDFDSDGERLDYTYNILNKLFKEYEISYLSMESSTGFGKSFVRSNLQEGAGVMKLCAFHNKVEVVTPSPKHIKCVITDNGNAKKNLMKKAIAELANIENADTEHECDAVGVALTCAIDKEILKPFYIREKRKKKK